MKGFPGFLPIQNGDFHIKVAAVTAIEVVKSDKKGNPTELTIVCGGIEYTIEGKDIPALIAALEKIA